MKIESKPIIQEKKQFGILRYQYIINLCRKKKQTIITIHPRQQTKNLAFSLKGLLGIGQEVLKFYGIGSSLSIRYAETRLTE